MFILFLIMFVTTVDGSTPLAVTINTTPFEDAQACFTAIEVFSENVPSSPQNPKIAYCLPAQSPIPVPRCSKNPILNGSVIVPCKG